MSNMTSALRHRTSGIAKSAVPMDRAFSQNLADVPLASSAHVEPVSAVAEPPWPSQEDERFLGWEKFSRYPNQLSAYIVAGLLNQDGVPTIVESLGFSVEFTNWSTIWVPKQLVHRARWVLAWDSPTDAELIFLATGEFPREND